MKKFKVGNYIKFKEDRGIHFSTHYGIIPNKVYTIVKIQPQIDGFSLWIDNPPYPGSWWSDHFELANSHIIRERLGVK